MVSLVTIMLLVIVSHADTEELLLQASWSMPDMLKVIALSALFTSHIV